MLSRQRAVSSGQACLSSKHIDLPTNEDCRRAARPNVIARIAINRESSIDRQLTA
ncbi:MAG: hypothetical protein U0Z53_07240 [Blastocatellia bacterium]